MSDYQRIQLLVYSYAERIDAGDFEAVAALMSKARLLYLPSAEVLEGGAQVLSANRMRVKIYPHTGTPCTTHYVNNLVIELEGDRATAQSLFTVTQALEGFPLQTIMAGRYYDKFVKERPCVIKTILIFFIFYLCYKVFVNLFMLQRGILLKLGYKI